MPAIPGGSNELHDEEASRAPDAPRHGAGFWLYLGSLATVWALAASNILHGFSILFTAATWRRDPELRGAWRWPRVAPVMVPLILYALLVPVSIALSLEPRISLRELSDLFTLTTLPLAILWVRGTGDSRRAVDALLAMTVALALFGIGQYYLTEYGPIHNRIPGPFSHYQTFAGVLMVGDLLLLARLCTGGRWRRPWLWAAFAVVTWALALTLTRGPWVALAVVTAAVLLRYARRLALAVAVLGLVAVFVAPRPWLERARSIVELRDPSNYDRLCMIEAGMHMIGERPLVGIGPGVVRERYPIYRHPTAPRYRVVHLHNTFVHLAAERGLPALAVYLWLMIASLRLALRGLRREGGVDGPRADLWLGVVLVLAGFNVAGLFEANWRDTEVQRLVLFVLALPLCLAAPARIVGPKNARKSECDDDTS